MGRRFSYDGSVLSFLSRMTDLIWLNILFLICSIPIFTIGASVTALYYVTLKMAKNEESHITKLFFKSFVQNFKQATGIWLIFLVIASVLLTDFFVINRGVIETNIGGKNVGNVILVISGVVAILMGFIYVYVFPLLAQFDNTVKNTIRNAFLISIKHLPYTIMFIAITVIPFVLLYFVNTALITFFIMFALAAYINSIFFNKIFIQYMPKDEKDNGDEHIFSDGEVNV